MGTQQQNGLYSHSCLPWDKLSTSQQLITFTLQPDLPATSTAE